MNRFLKFSLTVIMGLILLALGILYYCYANFNSPRYADKWPVVQENLAYFADNYQSARKGFRDATLDIKRKYPNTEVSQIEVDSSMDSDLTVDWCYIPSNSNQERILVISSGMHGVEGYVGSAVQQLFMDKYLNDSLLETQAILLIHTLNPWGFKYSRRVTESNVDLNRNCSLSPDIYTLENPGYSALEELLNPREPLDMSASSRRFFFLKAANVIRKSSMKEVRQAILGGQYSYKTGTWFGGHEQESQVRALVPILRRLLKPYSSVFTIDLHTGYGERGKLHLMSDPATDDVRASLEQVFEGFQIDWGDHEDFYTTTGSFPSFIEQFAEGKKFMEVTFEFGTLNSLTTIGSMRSLNIMIAENQGYHHGYHGPQDKYHIQDSFIDMYFPHSEAWRSHAIEQSQILFNVLIPRLSANSNSM